MLDEAGEPVGYDVDLARAIAAAWGLDVEIVALGFDSLLDAVAADKVDSVVSAMPYDQRATRDYAYSSPYFDAGVRLVVREGSPVAGVDDLQGSTVAVEWGSMGDMVGRRLQRDGIDVALAPYAGPEEAVAALTDDPATDALLIDNVTLRQAQGGGRRARGGWPGAREQSVRDRIAVDRLGSPGAGRGCACVLARWRYVGGVGGPLVRGWNQVDRIRRYERPSFFAL